MFVPYMHVGRGTSKSMSLLCTKYNGMYTPTVTLSSVPIYSQFKTYGRIITEYIYSVHYNVPYTTMYMHMHRY